MPTPGFPANTQRSDPYQRFPFRIRWNGVIVAGVSQVSGLTHTPQEAATGQPEFRAITLGRGLTHNPDFEDWAHIWTYRSGQGSVNTLSDFRKDILIEHYNEAGQRVLAYIVYHCWVSEYNAMSDPDSSDSAELILSLTLENEGWEPYGEGFA
jgi:phage tail-like protein